MRVCVCVCILRPLLTMSRLSLFASVNPRFHLNLRLLLSPSHLRVFALAIAVSDRKAHLTSAPGPHAHSAMGREDRPLHYRYSGNDSSARTDGHLADGVAAEQLVYAAARAHAHTHNHTTYKRASARPRTHAKAHARARARKHTHKNEDASHLCIRLIQSAASVLDSSMQDLIYTNI